MYLFCAPKYLKMCRCNFLNLVQSDKRPLSRAARLVQMYFYDYTILPKRDHYSLTINFFKNIKIFRTMI